MSYNLPLAIRRPPNETGLTVLATLSEDNGVTPHATSRDIGSFVELPLYLSNGTTVYAVRYGRDDVPIPDGFLGVVVFHTGAVGAGADFSGVTVLGVLSINPQELETGRVVWTHTTRTLTQAAQTIADTISGSSVTLHRGDSISFQLTGLGDLQTQSQLWFTAKRKSEHADAAAEIVVSEADGLLTLAGQDPETGETGSITIDDPVAGDITIVLSAAAAKKLRPVSSGAYDVQLLTSGGTVTTLNAGTFKVTADVTRRIAA